MSNLNLKDKQITLMHKPTPSSRELAFQSSLPLGTRMENPVSPCIHCLFLYINHEPYQALNRLVSSPSHVMILYCPPSDNLY